MQLRQSYLRIAKRAAMMAGRYAHAKQFKRYQRELRILCTRLGRIIRDIRRKITGHPALEEAFEPALSRAGHLGRCYLNALRRSEHRRAQAAFRATLA